MAGKLVHIEISAADVDRAQGFWSGVFGWEISPSGMPGMDYRLFRTGDDQGGGLMAGEPGSLAVYFDTDDIEATIAQVRSGGGESTDRRPIPGVGWFANCKDTEGNAFNLYQSDEAAS
jgi:predicted enzyme related to lactoylglutathione lyase